MKIANWWRDALVPISTDFNSFYVIAIFGTVLNFKFLYKNTRSGEATPDVWISFVLAAVLQ